jgi:small conductance mechanosensitive channel
MLEAAGVLAVALVASWVARFAAHRLMRRAARRTLGAKPRYWRVRHDDASVGGEPNPRVLQRADALGSLIGRVAAGVIMLVATIVALQLVGVDPVVVISSAGFIGLAMAFGGQTLISDLVAGTRALLEDRYAIGDDIVVRVADVDVRGTVDLMGAASLRLRQVDGSAWHTGHGKINCVTNYSQAPALAQIALPLDEWQQVDPDEAASRLVSSSNDFGLTGVVFMPELEVNEPTDDGSVTVDVRASRSLTPAQEQTVRDRLLGQNTRGQRKRHPRT